MELNELRPVHSYCNNCGHKNIGYKARDQTVRMTCERCRLKSFSKQKDKRNMIVYLTAPNDEIFDWE